MIDMMDSIPDSLILLICSALNECQDLWVLALRQTSKRYAHLSKCAWKLLRGKSWDDEGILEEIKKSVPVNAFNYTKFLIECYRHSRPLLAQESVAALVYDHLDEWPMPAVSSLTTFIDTSEFMCRMGLELQITCVKHTGSEDNDLVPWVRNETYLHKWMTSVMDSFKGNAKLLIIVQCMCELARTPVYGISNTYTRELLRKMATHPAVNIEFVHNIESSIVINNLND